MNDVTDTVNKIFREWLEYDFVEPVWGSGLTDQLTVDYAVSLLEGRREELIESAYRYWELSK